MRLKKDGTPDKRMFRTFAHKTLPKKVEVKDQVIVPVFSLVVPEPILYSHADMDPKHKRELPFIIKTIEMLEKARVKVA